MPPEILDDVEEIRRIDKSGMLAYCTRASEHYREASRLAEAVRVSYPTPKTIIAAGMGGSAIGGELLKDLARPEIGVPIEVCREYSLPAYADEDTLVFITSYSGETEESLSTFLDAVERGCMTFCISSGGSLLSFAEKLGSPHIRVPSGIQPRAALPYLFLPMPVCLSKLGLISKTGLDISEAVQTLEQLRLENSPEEPSSRNFSKTLASNIKGTAPIIYGFGIYRGVAQRYKQEFNENSKVPSTWNSFPELNHNEIVGWEAAEELAQCFSLIIIRDRDETEQTKQRIKATEELIRNSTRKTFEVWSRGEGRLAKISSAIHIGDLTSLYLAIANGVNPTPVKTIALLKERVKQTGAKEEIIRKLRRLCRK